VWDKSSGRKESFRPPLPIRKETKKERRGFETLDLGRKKIKQAGLGLPSRGTRYPGEEKTQGKTRKKTILICPEYRADRHWRSPRTEEKKKIVNAGRADTSGGGFHVGEERGRRVKGKTTANGSAQKASGGWGQSHREV